MPLTHQQSFLILFLNRTAIVLCDEILPEFCCRGYDIQILATWRGLPIMLQSGYTEQEVVEIIGMIALNVWRNLFNLVVRTTDDFEPVKLNEPLPQSIEKQQEK